VWCWGVNTYGQLGDGTHVTRTMPVRVHNLTQVVQLEVKQDETCARLVDGTIWCWGANDLGELGDGTTTNRSLPTKVQGIPGPVNQFQMSGAGACASNAAGLVWCWGANFDGQLGDGTTDPHLSAVEANVTDVAGVAPADGSTCVRTKALTALCWGADDVGQLGTGGASGVPYLTPQPVEDLAHARGLTGGGDHVCAVVAGGTMYCWGSNGSGQLGEGFLGGNQVNPTLVLS